MSRYATVLMSVFNGERWLEDAIRSVLTQSFSDFDFIIIDDGSIDHSEHIVRSFSDHRIKFLRNDKQIGLPMSLNRGLEVSKGRYIIRMDADDVSLPLRFEKQIAFLDANQNIGVCGSWVQTFGDKCEILKAEENHKEIVTKLFFSNALFHPSVTIRRDVLSSHRLLYESGFTGSEDYRLWVRLAEVTEFANLQEVLLNYRIHRLQVTKMGGTSDRIRIELTERLIGREMNTVEKTLHRKVFFEQGVINEKDIRDLSHWMNILIEANRRHAFYIQPMFVDRLMNLKKFIYKKYLWDRMANDKYNNLKVFRFIFSNYEIMKNLTPTDYLLFFLSYLKMKSV